MWRIWRSQMKTTLDKKGFWTWIILQTVPKVGYWY